MDKPAESIIRPAFVLMSGRALGFVAAFIIPLVLVRVFNQAEFGTYKQVFLIYGTLFGIIQFGMAESLYYFLPSDSPKTGKYVFNAMLGLGIAGAVCFIVLLNMRPAIAHWLNNPELTRYIHLIGVFLMLMLVSVVLEIVMTVRRQNVLASSTYALSDILRAIMCIVPVILLGDLKWLLFGMITFAVCRLTMTLFYLRYEFGPAFGVDVGLMKKHLAYAIPFGFAAIIEITQANLHMYAVSYHFDAAKFAIYAVGCFQIPLTDLLMTSTSNVLMVNMREKIIQGKMDAVRKMWYDTTRKLVLIFCIIVGGLFAIADEFIVLLFTSTYEQSVPVFMVWTLSIVFAGFLTDAVLRVYAQNSFLILLNTIKLILVAVTISWFITNYDLIGAVMVTLLVALVAKVIALGRVMNLIQSNFREFLPWGSLGQTILITVTASSLAILVKVMLGLPNISSLIITGAVYTLIYAVLLMLSGVLKKQEKLVLSGYVRTSVSRLCWNWKT